MTVEEYLRFEERSKFKHEYMDGEIFRLHAPLPKAVHTAGSHANRVFLVSNLCFFLRLALREKGKNYKVGATEMRVMMREGHYAYPDVFAVCGELSFVPNIFDTLENPAIIFEVLSPSTESRDRGDKAVDYRNLKTLTDYVIVSQNKMRVEQQTRLSDNSWIITIYEQPEDKIVFESLDCELKLADIYENIKFPAKPNLQLVQNKKNKG